jgi:phosphatidylserine/phosphatidylglycerophosphate/cardiolipin synthase-like enzyme
VEGLAVLGEGHWAAESICAAAVAGIAPGDAVQVLAGLAVAGVCARAPGTEDWSTHLAPAELRRLSNLLRGADHYRRLRLEALSVELAVTMPLAPSLLEAELGSSPGRPGNYLATSQAFLRVARAAQSRLVIMTPFLDGRGFGWLKDLVEEARPQAEKIIVLRDADQYTIELGVQHADWLRAADVSVRDYHMSHSHAAGRALPIETFHAKIMLADENLAYVGSANILGSSDGTSLEAGVLVDGRAALQVSRLVGGVLRIARRL